MRIRSVEAVPVRIPMQAERKMVSALGDHFTADLVLVRLTTDDGLEGVGEAAVTPRWSGETLWGATAIVWELFGPLVCGCDPADVDEIERRLDAAAVGNWFAKAAVEMACWDVAGRAAGRPVFELLGGACRALEVKSRFSMGAYAPEVAAERAAERVARGFDTIKVKVGTRVEDDVARVRAVREAIGPDVRLTVDANGGWSEAEALDALERMRGLNLAVVEQPVERGNRSGMARIRSATECKILVDEGCFDEIEARELMDAGACDALSLYPGKQGGIAKARRIARLAEERGVPCTLGSNLEGDVGTAAMLHFAVATSNLRDDLYPGDCLGPSYQADSIVKEPIEIEGPITRLRSGPGLGVEVDWARVERYRI